MNEKITAAMDIDGIVVFMAFVAIIPEQNGVWL